MEEVWIWLLGLLPTVITGCILFYVQRAQKRRDKKEEERALARKEEFVVMLNLQMATAKLAYAVAVALKRGHANGEVEKAVEAYDKALEKFQEFERKQLSRL